MEQRLIDANALGERLKDERDFYKKMYDCMQQPCEQDERAIIGAYYTAYSKSYHMAKDAPTVDVVPVVRCSKCRMSYIADESMEPYGAEIGKRYCASGRKVTDDFFCADGKRKDGEND